MLLRAGTSLTEPPVLADSAIGYWQALSATSGQLLGYGHAQSVLARDRLADAYASSGRFAEALPVFEATLADREATFGPQHPETVTARLNVARSLNAAGREPEAIALYEQVLAARERMFGPGHRETLAVRVQLAAAYEAAGPARRQHPAVRAGARRRRAGARPGSPGHAVRPRQPGAARTWPPARRARRSPPTSGRSPTRSGRPGADAPGHAGHAGQPGQRLPGRGEDQGGDRRVRAGARRPGAGTRGRPSRHDRRARQPRLRLPQRGAAEGGHTAVRAGGGRPGAAAAAPTIATRSPRGPSSAPPTSRGGGCARRSRPTSGWSPTASGRSARATSTR